MRGWSDNPNDMVILTEDNPNPMFKPTRQNILNALQWLAAGNRSGDSLFFHFSGHGGQRSDSNGDESDGMELLILILC